MSDAEVLTTALAAAQFFCGNLEHARRLFCAPPYIPGMLSRSRLNRRRHRLAPKLQTLLDRLGACEIHDAGSGSEAADYVLDSFPVAACDNIRIRRSRLYRGEAYRGWIASKRRFFYGLRIHVLATTGGQIVEAFLAPASLADVEALKRFRFDLPPGSVVYADKAYNDYTA